MGFAVFGINLVFWTVLEFFSLSSKKDHLKKVNIDISDSLSFMIFGSYFSLIIKLHIFTILDVFTYFNMINAPHLKNLSPFPNLSILSKHNFWSKKILSTWPFEVWLGPEQARLPLKSLFGQ